MACQRVGLVADAERLAVCDAPDRRAGQLAEAQGPADRRRPIFSRRSLPVSLASGAELHLAEALGFGAWRR